MSNADAAIDERIKETSYITLGGTARLLEQISSALDYSHGKSVVHRDLKPSNIIVTADGAVRITDVGLSPALRDAGRLHFRGRG